MSEPMTAEERARAAIRANYYGPITISQQAEIDAGTIRMAAVIRAARGRGDAGVFPLSQSMLALW
jgi:hypothetical protein